LGTYLALPQERLYLVAGYVMPTHLFLILFSAWGISLTFYDLPSERVKKFRIGTVVATGLVLLGLSVFRFQTARQTHYTYAYDYVLNGWKATPRDALYYCKGDSVVFPCWYFQWAEKKRMDLSIIGVDGLPMDWIRKNLAQIHPGLKVPFTPKPVGNEAIIPMAQWLVDKNPSRELYFSYNKVEDGTLPGIKLVPYGLVTKGFLKGTEPSLEEARSDYFWKVMRLRNMGDPKLPIDPHTRELMVRDYGIFRNSLGVYYEDLGDDLKAKPAAKSTAMDLLNAQHDYEKSRESFEWAQRWDPLDAQYAYNLGNSFYHVGRVGDSMVWYEKATQLNPQYNIAYFNWAVAAMAMGQYQKAGDLFKKVLELKPDYTQAQQGLDYVTKQGFYKPQ
jgi:Tetratricopeptide repeat